MFAAADTTLKDARGFDVMIEAARGNREDIIDVLRRSGAKTGISIMLQVSQQCDCCGFAMNGVLLLIVGRGRGSLTCCGAKAGISMMLQVSRRGN